MNPRLLRSTLGPFLRALAALLPALAAAGALPAQDTGRLAGIVRNSDTGRVLEGASATIAAAGLQTLTDELGGFVFRDLPAGEHLVMFSYTGVDPVYKTALVTAGAEARLDVEMSSQIYKLPAFTVTGEREGNAAAIVRQKTAGNIKAVVSLDAFGQLPNDNAGELLIRLAGMAGEVNEDGDVSGMIIRGIAPALNTASVNGNLQSSSGGMSREFRTGSLTGAIFDELEVIKSSTPDMGADGLGGVVNFKTRSALTVKEKRRVEYRAGARWAPPFYSGIPLRRRHSVHPLFNLQYQESFDAPGGSPGERNLGVAASAFYSENVNGTRWVTQDYAYTAADPAYIWSHLNRNTLGDRRQTTFSLNTDYILSPRTKIFVRGFYNDAFEFAQKNYIMRAYVRLDGQGNPYTPAAIGGHSAGRTEILPTGDSRFNLQSITYSFLNRERQAQVGAEHTFDRLKIDYDFSHNRNHANLGNGTRGHDNAGTFQMEVDQVGWVVDQTGPGKYPLFTQTAGVNIHDPGVYKWINLVMRDNKRNTDVHGATFNAKYAPPAGILSFIKTGYRYRRQKVEEINNASRWHYGWDAAHPFPLAPDSGAVVDGAENLPFYDPAAVRRHLVENTVAGTTAVPGKWYQSQSDLDYEADQNYGGTRDVAETVHAGYLMAQARLGRIGLIAGARYERTGVAGRGWIDLDGDHNYAEHGRNYIKSSHDDWFPGAHLTCTITPNLLARAGWSRTIGRPAFTHLVPGKTVNETAGTVRLNNDDLKPQYSRNWDLSLEYYFEPVGSLSIGAFYKKISGFIVASDMGAIASGPDNGFSGAYDGYTLYSQFNGGDATVRGLELAWQQQFTFLPGFLKGLGAFANYTLLTTDGNYGDSDTANPVTKLVKFVPRTANAGLSYRYRKISARVMANYTGAYLSDYADEEYRLRYRDERLTVNISLSHAVRPAVRFYIDIINAFNEPQRWYRYRADRPAQILYSGTAIYAGISGRF
jgi:TonB-dependent receptor